MILPFLLALVAFGALLPILAPLLRGSRPSGPEGRFDQAVYRDQLQELDRDLNRGLITQTDANTARVEIQRRLLSADRKTVVPPRIGRSPILASIVFVFVAGGSLSLYLWLGSPGIPDEPYNSRSAEAARSTGGNSLQQATDQLAAKLKANPTDAAGWLLYARSLVMLSDWNKAEDAYRHAMDLGQNSPDIQADHAEVMVMQAGGIVPPAAASAFEQIQKQQPDNPMARYYLALAAMQAGEPHKAIDGFQALLAQMPADSPARDQIADKIRQTAQSAGIPVPELAKGSAPQPTAQTNPGPDANAMSAAANMTPEQRQQMVRGMVARLAAEQEANPGNLDGWLQLGRAYAVLNQPDKAADAFAHAAKLRPGDVSIRLQEIRALVEGHPPTEKLPPNVLALLKQVQTTDPDQPMVLWYLGMAAAQDGNAKDARDDWGKLLAHLPANSADAKMIQAALDALPKQ